MNDTIFPLNQAHAGVDNRAQSRATATPWHAVETALVTRLLGVNPTEGLAAREVATRRLSYGSNNVGGFGTQRVTSMLVLLCFGIAVGFVLTAAILNDASGDSIEAVSLVTVIAIGSIAGFAYVLKAARALDTMHNVAQACARVRREGKQLQVEAQELVPGDIVILEAGDSVPADARLIEAAQLQVKETALTGKKALVEKGTSPASKDAPMCERQSMVYFGTSLNSGSGVAVVVATGSETELGKIAACDS
jgi:P-type Ca2+ transporter type 2C